MTDIDLEAIRRRVERYRAAILRYTEWSQKPIEEQMKSLDFRALDDELSALGQWDIADLDALLARVEELEGRIVNYEKEYQRVADQRNRATRDATEVRKRVEELEVAMEQAHVHVSAIHKIASMGIVSDPTGEGHICDSARLAGKWLLKRERIED